MPSRSGRLIVASLLAVAIAGLALSASAETGSVGPKGGIVEPEAALTVGALARRLASEAVINAPSKGGLDEEFSVGLFSALGYEAPSGPSTPATVGDLRGMLSALGVEATAERPEEPLSGARLSRTLDAVRSLIPRFEIPESHMTAAGIRVSPETHTTGECFAKFLQCKRECVTASPSVPLGGCFERCFFKFLRCRFHLESMKAGR